MKKAGLVTIIVFACVGVILSFTRIRVLQEKYPNPKIVTYKESNKIKGGNITISLEKSELLDSKGFKKNFPQLKEYVYEDIPNTQKKTLMIELIFENTSKEEQVMDITQFMVQSGVWANGWDQDAFFLLNEREEITIKLAPLESETINLPFDLYEVQFENRKIWNEIDKQDFYLVFSVYPIKNQVKLKL